jgi:hypothetical protein
VGESEPYEKGRARTSGRVEDYSCAIGVRKAGGFV